MEAYPPCICNQGNGLVSQTKETIGTCASTWWKQEGMVLQSLSSFSITLIPSLMCQFTVPTDVTSEETCSGEPLLPEARPRVTWPFSSSLPTDVSMAWTDHSESDPLEWQPFSSAGTVRLTQTKKQTGATRVGKLGPLCSLTFPISLTLARHSTTSDSQQWHAKISVWEDPDGQPRVPQAGGWSLPM